MSIIQTILMGIIAALMIIGAVSGVQDDEFSYIAIAPSDEDLIDTLNKAGARGYEVVSARRATSSTSSPFGAESKAKYEFIMMRRGKGSVFTPPLLPEK